MALFVQDWYWPPSITSTQVHDMQNMVGCCLLLSLNTHSGNRKMYIMSDDNGSSPTDLIVSTETKVRLPPHQLDK